VKMIESLFARIREYPLLTGMVALLVICGNAWFDFHHPLWTGVDAIFLVIVVIVFLQSEI
jgi:hypothetical protein